MSFFERLPRVTLPVIFFLGFMFIFSGMARDRQSGAKYKTFPVKLTVDFGVAQKEGFDGIVFVEKDMNLYEVVGQVYPILYGKACCSLREIVEIGGVHIDPLKNYWWKVSLNGSQKVTPRKQTLKKGDYLEWRYIVEDQ